MKEPYVPPETMERMKKFFLKTSVPRIAKEMKKSEENNRQIESVVSK